MYLDVRYYMKWTREYELKFLVPIESLRESHKGT